MPKTSSIHLRRVAESLCPRCGTSVPFQGDYCEDHKAAHERAKAAMRLYRAKNIARSRAIYKERRDKGLCGNCGRPVAPELATCAQCYGASAMWRRKNKERYEYTQKTYRLAQKVDRGTMSPTEATRSKRVLAARKDYMKTYMAQYWKDHPDKYAVHLAKTRVAAAKRREARRGIDPK